MKTLTVIGLICQFFAFWFAAPELLGAQTLIRMESGIKKLVTYIPIIVTLTIILGYGLTFIGISGYNAYQMSQTGEIYINPTIYFITMGLFTLLYIVFMFRYKKIKSYLENKVAIPLTFKLLHNNETRKNALIIGAILFTFGFVAQLIAVLLT
ncbi:MAG: hypothetical protein ACI9JN_000025 [Bacteroidia bacterium]|jgi:hypothetical protein